MAQNTEDVDPQLAAAAREEGATGDNEAAPTGASIVAPDKDSDWLTAELRKEAEDVWPQVGDISAEGVAFPTKTSCC